MCQKCQHKSHQNLENHYPKLQVGKAVPEDETFNKIYEHLQQRKSVKTSLSKKRKTSNRKTDIAKDIQTRKGY